MASKKVLVLELGPDECWPWMGCLDRDGYGKYRGRGAHRVLYERRVGPIPQRHQLDHRCRNHGCVNHMHLEPVTKVENQLRGLRGLLITHCPQGHPYDAVNTYLQTRKTGGMSRNCKTCHRDRSAMRARRKRQEERMVMPATA